jgi:hypothetical protein
MPLVVATRAKLDPNLESLSRIRYFGACPNGVASLRCWAPQGSDGERVTPTWMTLRDCSSIMKNAKSGRKNRSVTGKRVARPDLGCVGARDRSPTSGLVAAVYEHVSNTFGSCAYRHGCPVSGVLHESFQHRRRRFCVAIRLIKAIVSAGTFG